MSPYEWHITSYVSVFIVDSFGYLTGGRVNSTSYCLRPVINLKSDTTFSSGNGTLSSPYEVA